MWISQLLHTALLLVEEGSRQMQQVKVKAARNFEKKEDEQKVYLIINLIRVIAAEQICREPGTLRIDV